MNRTPYLGVIAALALIIFAGAILRDLGSSQAFVPPASSAPALEVTSPVESGSITASTKEVVPATQSTNKKKKAVPVQNAPVEDPASSPSVAPAAPTQASYDSSAAALRGALVNILCYAPAGSGLRSISGSGVIVDPKGIILTNAHIGQYFLFANRGVSCTVRTGSPAVDSYKAVPIYISPEWIRKNASAIAQDAPTGTGEYDFAFLAIERSATKAALPSLFPSISLALTPIWPGTPIVIASYGAQFLESSQIQSFLFPTVVFGTVKDIFTFATTTIDVLALGGSPAAQEGSSGGGVASASDGALVGVITTSTVSGATDTRTLSAITASYIRAEYARETGTSLEILLTKPVSEVIADFVPKISPLEAILTANLSR